MEISDHLTCLLRNLYAGQEAIVRTERGTVDWFQIGKGVRQGCILSPCLFNLYTEENNRMGKTRDLFKKLFSSSLSYIRVVSSTYLRLLIFLLAILIPACALSSPAFCMMYVKLNVS